MGIHGFHPGPCLTINYDYKIGRFILWFIEYPDVPSCVMSMIFLSIHLHLACCAKPFCNLTTQPIRMNFLEFNILFVDFLSPCGCKCKNHCYFIFLLFFFFTCLFKDSVFQVNKNFFQLSENWAVWVDLVLCKCHGLMRARDLLHLLLFLFEWPTGFVQITRKHFLIFTFLYIQWHVLPFWQSFLWSDSLFIQIFFFPCVIVCPLYKNLFRHFSPTDFSFLILFYSCLITLCNFPFLSLDRNSLL